MNKNLFLSKTFFFSILFVFLFSIFYFDSSFNDKTIVKCTDLDYESALNNSPKNFKNMNISIDFLKDRKWTEIILNNHGSFVKKGFFENGQKTDAIITIAYKNNTRST